MNEMTLIIGLFRFCATLQVLIIRRLDRLRERVDELAMRRAEGR